MRIVWLYVKIGRFLLTARFEATSFIEICYFRGKKCRLSSECEIACVGQLFGHLKQELITTSIVLCSFVVNIFAGLELRGKSA